jgi:hypothetical protein
VSKLYEVTMTVYVLADSPEIARNLAITEVQYEDSEARATNAVDHAWWEALPYRSHRDNSPERTCGQIVTEQRKETTP